MGNCIRKESKMQWGGEDWGSFGSTNKYRYEDGEEHEQSHLLVEESGRPGMTTTQVKIKITRDELENLLKRTEFEGLSLQQVLAELMSVSDRFEGHQHSWTPDLQSIAEE